jgi:branched-subunit amino acid transport protein
MSDAWTIVLVVGAATIAFKATGPVVLGGRELPERVRGVVALLAPTLLAALVVVSVFGRGRDLAVEAGMTAGMAAAVVALLLRAPIIVVVAAAAVTAALVRLL